MKSLPLRLSGTAAIAGGLILFGVMLYGFFVELDLEDAPWLVILPLVPLLLAAGAAGLWSLADGNRVGRAGAGVALAGGLVMATGLALMAWFDSEAGWGTTVIGMLLIPLGLFIYGLAAWRAALLPRWNRLPLAIGLVVGVGLLFEWVEELRAIPWWQQADLGFLFWIVAVGLGWPLLGLAMGGAERSISGNPSPA